MNQRHRDITAASRSHIGRGVGEGRTRNDVGIKQGQHQRGQSVYAVSVVKVELPWFPRSRG